MIRVCLFPFILLTQVSTINNEGCDSFNNTLVMGRGQTEEVNEEFLVNGCLEPKVFKGKDFRELFIINGITRLGQNSVRNLPELMSLRILSNRLEILEPRAFSNVPSLKSVEIWETNLTEIPEDVFNLVSTIISLTLAYNKIDFIASRAFSNMKSLESINLNNNAITYWNREWFQNCPNLKKISFYSNKISIIQRKAFASLPSLRVIELGGNKITTIQPDAFQNLEYLNFLGLDNNGLTRLDERAFPNIIRIETLYINNNRFNYLPEKLLKRCVVGIIIMDQNPWKCPCMQQIHNWLFFTSGSVGPSDHPCRTPHDPICVVPPGNACEETVEEKLTRWYLDQMRNLTNPLGEECVNLFS